MQNLITFVSVFYILVEVNLWIVLAILITCIPSVVLSYLQKGEDYRYNTRNMKAGSMVVQYFWYCVSPFSMEEVRHYGILEYFKHLWISNADNYVGMKNAMTKKHVLHNAITDVLRDAVYIVALLLVAYEIYQNPAIGLGTFTLVYSSAGQLQDVTSKLFVSAAMFYSDINYMKDFFDLEKLERDQVDLTVSPIQNATIEFKNVDFSYPNTSERTLKNINVTIRQGEKIAIVGENGSGKSTFVSLLCGMYEPDSGEINIGGRSIQEQLPAVRNSISAVFQDFGRYEASLRENITVSDKQKNAPDEDLWALVNKTNASDVIEIQPNKFDEQIGLFSKTGKIVLSVAPPV
jgi:ABC-type multidrug transport system fused ATPase/permease subunit